MDTTDHTSSMYSEAPSSSLVECHSCGYQIPPEMGSRCPECSATWDKICGIRESLRHDVKADFVQTLQASGIVWLFVLIFFAIGAGIAAQGDLLYAPAFVFFGIGGGVIASTGGGIWICKLGPSHQLKLHADIWTKKIWWLHAPWLLIAPFTIVGSAIGLITRLINPATVEGVMFAFISIGFLAWALLSLAAGIIWLVKYGEARIELGITNANAVVSLHIIYAILIWLGSCMVGFFGGMLGSIFMFTILGSDWTDF